MRRRKTGKAEATTTEVSAAAVAAVPAAAPKAELAEVKPTGGLQLPPIAMELGKYERDENAPGQAVGQPRLDFFHTSKNKALDIQQGLGTKCTAGDPYFYHQGRYYDAAALSYLILGDPFWYWSLKDGTGKPYRAFLSNPGKTFEGHKVHSCCEAMVLLLPGHGGAFPEDMKPAACGLLSMGGWTKIDLATNHMNEVEMTTLGGNSDHFRQRDAIDFAKRHPSHMDLPPAYRFASGFRVTTKPGNKERGVPPYAVIKGAPKPVTEQQVQAIGAFFQDKDCQDEREQVEGYFESKKDEIRGMVQA